jgi:CDP-paratose 2-epimerase
MNLLITGGCGFLGSNLAHEAIRRGIQLTVLDDLSREGSSRNLEWLRQHGTFSFIQGDVSSAGDVEGAVRSSSPHAVFHVAGQVAMAASILSPRRDFEVNALGTLNVLEAVRRHAPTAQVLYSSTNKVYGDLGQFRYAEDATRWRCIDSPDGFDESIPLSFHSPYGCSKGCADQYMLDYHRIYGISTSVFRHSSMYGGRQFATYDQGWVGWFCSQAAHQAAVRKTGQEPAAFTISGDGKQVRDVLHADDMVALYFAAVEAGKAIAGQAFNVGGGMENSLSLLELFARLEGLVGTRLRYRHLPPRPSDQLVFVANCDKIRKAVNWNMRVGVASGLANMMQWTIHSGQQPI